MKLFVLGILLLIGFPAAMYLILGPDILDNASVVVGTVGVAVVLFAMACLCTIKNVLSFFVDLLLVTVGAFLILIAAFAKPLGLLDNEEGQAIEDRIMGTSKEQRMPQQQHNAAEDVEAGTPPLDELLDDMAEEKDGHQSKENAETAEDAEGAANAEESSQQPEDDVNTNAEEAPAVPPKEKPTADAKEKPALEGLERFKEESGQD